MDKDYLLAVKLSKELNSLNNASNHNNKSPSRNKIERYTKYAGANNGPDLNSTNNIVHPDWETIDPTPDIYTMFGAFDLKFFQGKLQCVTLEWSKRMYNCAGICYSRKNRLGMQCTIRLSEPLLKLRSRKNLIETLLHEMIHAYLFIKGIQEGNGGHGPNFKKMMEGINRAAGTNITVYHTFYDEVNLYKTHWWRCNGICQHRKPFFGYVKRVYNRAPGPNDMWWKAHHDSCSGTFEKVKEPETTKKNSKTASTGNVPKSKITMPKGEIKANNVSDIRMFFPTKQGSPVENTGNKLTNPINSRQPMGNLSNVVGLKDLPTSDDETPSHSKTKVIEPFTGLGRNLSDTPIDRTNPNVNLTVRDKWTKRFGTADSKDASSSKRPRLVEQTIEEEDDLILIEEKNPIVDLLDSDEEEEKHHNKRTVTNQTSREKQDEILNDIKSSIHNNSDDEDDNDVIVLIDGDFDDSIVNDPTELINKKVMDDLFGDDTLLNRYQTSTSQDSDLICLTENNTINCPLCQERLSRNDLAGHLEGCLGIKVEVKPVKYKVPRKMPFYKNKAVKRQVVVEDDSSDGEQQTQVAATSQPDNTNLGTVCPVCNVVQQGDINEHLDICLTVSFD